MGNEPRPVWTYYISRDSLDGVPAATCNLWWVKPTRVKHRYHVTWVASNLQEPGHLGEYPVEHIDVWFRTRPDTDLELIKAEQWATPEKK